MKTILITGSTDGIGKGAALLFAQSGYKVILHGRNATKLNSVMEEVQGLAPSASVTGYVADFTDLKAVQELAHRILAEVPQIDVLINNAGVFNSAKSKTSAGLDPRFVVNYLAPYILTHALLPHLKQQAGSRIINLSSAAQAPVSMAALQGKQRLSAQGAYAQSKLALTMWSFHLAQHIPGLEVIAVNPGSLLNTKMVREAFGQHWSSADKGARILFELAVADEYEGKTGLYFDNDLGNEKGSFGRAHPDAYDQVRIEKLIEGTKSLLVEVLG